MPLHRYSGNPIITRRDISASGKHLIDVSSVFNPGAIWFNGKILLLLRVQNRGRETFLVKAESSDGKSFSIDNREIKIVGLDSVQKTVYHCYDPRITKIGDTFYIMFAMDLVSSCKLGLAKTNDFETYSFMGIVSEVDNRNGVLFPQMFNGKYIRLDRPNPPEPIGGSFSGDTVWLSESKDLLSWKKVKPVFSGRHHYWDELIGAGPPPLKTPDGWLLLYHGIATHFQSVNIYQVGAVLLDLKNPAIVLARTKYNILEPRESYELTGQVPNVVFPTGLIVKDDLPVTSSSEFLIYFGAADTSVCLATATVGEIMADLEPI
ncbi:MAG: glycoside hydrolase family 130 protein [SAR324 cluster bacterium]|nr:glycoside hydrolase family 130 protein [SAR324 cluster bacterium]